MPGDGEPIFGAEAETIAAAALAENMKKIIVEKISIAGVKVQLY